VLKGRFKAGGGSVNRRYLEAAVSQLEKRTALQFLLQIHS
jgi:hypothetical protein